MQQKRHAHSVTFDSAIPDDYPARQLRSRRAFHPTIDPSGVFQFELRALDGRDYGSHRAPRRDDDDNLHYSDGTVVDAGPRSSSDAEHDQPVTLHGFAGAEWFDSSLRSSHYWRCLFNTHTSTLTIDEWNGNNRTEHVRLSIPAERLGDPQSFVDAIAATSSPVETAELFDVFFSADVSAETIGEIADSDALTDIL